MLNITDGQCGKCAHFGEASDQPKLIQIRISGQAEPETVEPCSLPQNAELNLKVAPNSGCGSFTPAKVA